MRFFGVFIEAIKKLAVAGVVSASFMALTSFLACVIGAADIGIVISYLIPYITVPALVICAFGFLFKRKSCDVFFAMPVKRSTLYFANMLSVILWTVVSYLLPFLIVGINTSFSYVISEYGGLYLGHLATCLYILGGTTIAIFLTGMVFSAIINTIIIAIVPRLVYLVIYNGIFNKLDYLVKDAPGQADLSGDSYLTMGFIESERMNYIILGLILILLGFVLFINRKSETAEHSAPNKLLKIIYSSVLAFSVSLIAISHYIDRYGFFSVNDSTAWILYGISILIPFAYELITVKRFNFKYAFISLAILIVLNAASYSAYYLGLSYYKNQKIDVKGYQVINYHRQDEANSRGYEYLYVWGDYNDDDFAYNQLLVNEYFLKNPQNIEILEKRLNEVQKSSKNYLDKYNEYVVALQDEKGKIHYRSLPINTQEMNALWYYATTSDEGFLEKTSTVPAPSEVKKVNCFNNAKFDKALYDIFYEEMMALTPEQRISLTYTVDTNCNIYMPENENDINRSITVMGVKNGKQYRSIYKINKLLCPKTFKIVKERVFEENRGKIENMLKSTENEYENFTVQLEVMPEANKYKNPKPYKITAEKTASYQIEKTNPNIAWTVNDDEISYKYSYSEYDFETVQKFFDSITQKFDDYESAKTYSAKVIVSYVDNDHIYGKTQSFSYEFNMTNDEFKEIYNMLKREE